MLGEDLDTKIKSLIKNSFKAGEKYLNKIDLNKIDIDTYIKTLGTFPISLDYKNKDVNIILTSSYFENISARRTIIETLNDINFRRGNNWTEKIVIAFMDEVISLYLYEGNDEIIRKREEEISYKYNVPINRLKTQVALFIINLDNNHDKFNILEYFSKYEIIMWKYRDIDKLQELIEEEKVPENDLKLLRDLKFIV